MAAGHRTSISLLARPRVSALTAGMQVVILQGPGGYGKTTFGDHVLTSTELAAARVRLGRTTGGAGLLDGIARACRRAGLSDLANSADGTTGGSAVDRLLGAMAERDDPVVLMIDEAQFLSDEGAAVLADLAADLPARCRLVIAGRRIPAGRYGLAGRTVTIGAAELRFDATEIAELLGPDADDVLVSEVARLTDGWPAAVALVAANLDSDATWSPAMPAAGRRLVVTLLDQLLRPLPDSVRATLSGLARFPLLDAEVIDHLGGTGAANSLFDVGLPMQQAGRWSIIPDAIREALRPAGSSRPSRSARDAARWVASHYAACGELASAASLLVVEGDLEGLATLLAERHWTELETLGLGTVRLLIDMLGETIATAPQALLHAVWLADRRDPTLKQAWLDRGLQSFADGPARRSLLAEHAIEAARRGEVDEAEATATAVVAAAPHTEHITRGRALIGKAMAHAFRSTPVELRSAEQALESAVANLHVAGEHRWEAYALDRLANLVLSKRGEFQQAADTIELAFACSRTQTRDRLTLLTTYADVLDLLGRVDEAMAAASEAMNVGRRWSDALAIGFGAWSLAWSRSRRGDRRGTLQALQAVEEHPGLWMTQLSGQEYLVDAAIMMTLLGEYDAAARYRDQAAAHPQGNDDLLAVLDARMAAIVGDPSIALKLLAELEGTAYAEPSQSWRRALLGGVAALRSGDLDQARSFVRAALQATEQLGLSDLPERHEALLVRTLAPVWPKQEERAAKSATRLTMLGGFALRRGADDCTPSPGNGATLVKLLGLRASMNVEQVIDVLWPDADLTTGRSRLRNLLNRIRSQSGEVIERRGESLSLAADVLVDVAEFEEAAAEAFAAESTQRAGVARLVLAAHSGELLPADTYEDWAAAPRERLKRRLLSLVDIVVDEAFDKADLDDAVRWLDMAIGIEPLEESRYVRACDALIVQGRRATARQVAERATAMLGDLGVQPSRRLLAVLDALD